MSSIGRIDERGEVGGSGCGADAGTRLPRQRRDRGDWLEDRLRAMHDEVVAEPLPSELQSLLDAIDR